MPRPVSTTPSAERAPSRGELTDRVRDAARRLGFDAVGIARADVPLDLDFARYEAFVARGMHGEMSWLAELSEVRRRVDTAHVLEGAKSAVCLARRYDRPAAFEANDPPFARALARYARGRDYHNGLRKKLRKLAAFVRALVAGAQARPLCDAAPVLERAWAARAGLGFIGKNGLLIVPGQGSFVLLGEVVTTLELAPDEPLSGRCGACTRCLSACPTGAFEEPFVLNATKCVAYLTMEHRSQIPPELREGVGGHLFGCDECQIACPFNAQGARPKPAVGRSFEPHPRWAEVDVASLLSLDEAGWLALREGSPIGRAELAGIARNAAIVLGNSKDPGHADVLRRAAREHPSAVVREAAAWACSALGLPC